MQPQQNNNKAKNEVSKLEQARLLFDFENILKNMFVTHVNSTTLFLTKNDNDNVIFDNLEYDKLKKDFIEQFGKLAKYFSDSMKEKEETNEQTI